MKINTINSIEIASICNGNCPYCPAKEQGKYRKVGLMKWDVFEKAIEWVRLYAERGTQKEVNLFGIGESTLHPECAEMVKYARDHIPLRLPIHMNTNGIKMTYDLALKLRIAGISHVDITGHDHYHTAKTIEIFRKAGLLGNLNYDFVTRPNNWAGQVEWFQVPKEVFDPGLCPWLSYGQVMVMSDGNVTHCCIDAFGKGIVGNIFDDIESFDLEPFELCKTCHHDVPEGLIKVVSTGGAL